MSIYPNSYNKIPKQPIKSNPVSQFLTKSDINWNPQSFARTVAEIKIWSSGGGIKWAGVLIGKYEVFNGRIRAVISDVVTLPAWNIANRHNNIQILVEDFWRVKKAKQAAGIILSHPSSDLLPTMEEWSLFLYLHALYETDGLIFIIANEDGSDFAIYNFPNEEAGSKSFVELFKREKAEAQKRTRRGQAERPVRGA
jgi:hypothetical protein